MAKSVPPDEQRCTATSQTSGERCKAARLRDRDTCLAHSHDRQSFGFAVGGNQVAAPRRVDRLAEIVENDIDTWLAPYVRGLDDDDVEVAMKAATAVLNRVYGTPKQSVDVAHSGGLSLEALLSPDPLTPTNSELPEEGE